MPRSLVEVAHWPLAWMVAAGVLSGSVLETARAVISQPGAVHCLLALCGLAEAAAWLLCIHHTMQSTGERVL